MPNYQKTKTACYLGFITQAIAANFAPLLFLKFHKDYGISLGNIALISTFYFFTQLLIDLFCAKFVDRIGYRVSIVVSEVCSAIGLIGLAFLPDLLPDAFAGILISVTIYAVGCGLIEVLASPIIEACPFENKEATMSLLHSFYCWGTVGTIVISTVFFAVFGLGLAIFTKKPEVANINLEDYIGKDFDTVCDELFVKLMEVLAQQLLKLFMLQYRNPSYDYTATSQQNIIDEIENLDK